MNYAISYSGKDLQGKAAIRKEKKAVGSLTDEQGEEVIKYIGDWSDDKFKARKSSVVNIINVENTAIATDKNDATNQVKEAQQIVNSIVAQMLQKQVWNQI